jgi:hypothetical protein
LPLSANVRAQCPIYKSDLEGEIILSRIGVVALGTLFGIFLAPLGVYLGVRMHWLIFTGRSSYDWAAYWMYGTGYAIGAIVALVGVVLAPLGARITNRKMQTKSSEFFGALLTPFLVSLLITFVVFVFL